jgi:hypothetical protein
VVAAERSYFSKVVLRPPEKIGSHKFDHELENFKNIILTFDLLIRLVANNIFRRSKIFKFIKLHQWLIFCPN